MQREGIKLYIIKYITKLKLIHMSKEQKWLRSLKPNILFGSVDSQAETKAKGIKEYKRKLDVKLLL